MKREISLEEISDGKLYGSGDMVKVGCDDCRGCSACCRGMGSSIVLDPYDIFRLETGLDLSFEELLAEAVELNLVDGMILPNLKMSGEGEACTFLNEEGGAAGFIPADRGSVGCFRLAGSMRTMASGILTRYTNAGRRRRRRSRSVSGWIPRIWAVMRTLLWSGITS